MRTEFGWPRGVALRRPEVIGTALVGLVLIALGAPRLVAAIAVESGGAAPQQRAQHAAAAARWHAAPATLKQLGLARRAIAESEPGQNQPALRQAARQALAAGLAGAPADPEIWAALAQLEAGEADGKSAAARALVLSLQTGPGEPALLWPRIALGLALWPLVVEGDRESVLQELRRGWSADPERLARQAADPAAAAALRMALADRPDVLVRFEELARRPGGG